MDTSAWMVPFDTHVGDLQLLAQVIASNEALREAAMWIPELAPKPT